MLLGIFLETRYPKQLMPKHFFGFEIEILLVFGEAAKSNLWVGQQFKRRAVESATWGGARLSGN